MKLKLHNLQNIIRYWNYCPNWQMVNLKIVFSSAKNNSNNNHKTTDFEHNFTIQNILNIFVLIAPWRSMLFNPIFTITPPNDKLQLSFVVIVWVKQINFHFRNTTLIALQKSWPWKKINPVDFTLETMRHWLLPQEKEGGCRIVMKG